MVHLGEVLQICIIRNCLQMSKCRFGVDKIDYLGHFVYEQEVRTDPSKLKVMS